MEADWDVVPDNRKISGHRFDPRPFHTTRVSLKTPNKIVSEVASSAYE